MCIAVGRMPPSFSVSGPPVGHTTQQAFFNLLRCERHAHNKWVVPFCIAPEREHTTMGQCCNCKGKAGLIFRTKLGDGSVLCSTCQKLFPDGILETAPYLTKEEALSWLSYSPKTQALSDAFHESHHYGLLHLDFRSGLLCLCPPGNINSSGKLKENPGDIYRIQDMTEISLEMKAGDPKNNTLIGDLYFIASFTKYGFRLHVCVQHAVQFRSEMQGNMIQYTEPGDLVFFRGDFDRTIRTVREKQSREKEMQKKLEEELAKKMFEAHERKKRQEQEKRAFEKKEEERLFHDAKTAFLLDDDYNMEDLKRQKRILLKAYHPDSGNTQDQRYFKKLMSYYDVLSGHLKEGP